MRDEETVEPKGAHTRDAKGGIRHAFGETGGSIGGHTRRTNGEQGLLRPAEKEGASTGHGGLDGAGVSGTCGGYGGPGGYEGPC